MTWHWIGKDDGRSGLEWRFSIVGRTAWVYIPGTDHADDARHHLRLRLTGPAPGVWVIAADLALAREIFHEIRDAGVTSALIAGHSWGGAIAALVVWLLNRAGVEAYGTLYAPKRVGNRRFVRQIEDAVDVYVHRGDLVPLMPPWLAGYPRELIGRWRWPWDAHQPHSYYEQMVEDGYR